jgi:hypothetical protein
MTVFRSDQRLPLPPEASIYTAIRALPDVSNASIGTPGPQGGWRVTVEVPDKPLENFDAIFGPEGQYLVTGIQGGLEDLGFGTWQVSEPDTGAFEVTSQKPLFEEAECIGWIETVFLGSVVTVPGEAASFGGVGHRTTFDLHGHAKDTITVTVRAERSNTIPVKAI